MKTIDLDLRCIQTVRALNIYLQYSLSLPDYYGRNLDALYDCLTERREETCLTLRVDEAPSAEMAAFLPGLRRMLEDAQRANPALHVNEVEA